MKYVAPAREPWDPRPEPKPINLDAPAPTPNASPLDWGDSVEAEEFLGEEWAVTFNPVLTGEVEAAFDLLGAQLGEVEDRFIHLSWEPDSPLLRMAVRRAETSGETLPDISSFADVKRLRRMINRENPALTAFNAKARALWDASGERLYKQPPVYFGA